jgi:hypothetical protein
MRYISMFQRCPARCQSLLVKHPGLTWAFCEEGSRAYHIGQTHALAHHLLDDSADSYGLSFATALEEALAGVNL